MKWSNWIESNLLTINSKGKDAFFYMRTSDTFYFLVFSVVVGLGAGFGAIAFRWLIAQFSHLYFTDGGTILRFLGKYYVVIIPALGGLIVGPLTYFFAREAKGHGVPEVISAVVRNGGKIKPKVAVVKALASSVCIGSGGSVGREGPIIQIGSAIGSTLGQIFRLTEDKTKTLVACGAAGGIAATFNAPLGGIFFALEVILREYGLRNFSSVVLSSVTATVISRHYFGDTPTFHMPPFELYGVGDLPYYFIFGFFAAFAAWLFIKVLYKSEDVFDTIKMPEYLKPAFGGLFIGIIGLYFPQVFGVGYDSIEGAIYNKMALWVIIALVFLKIIATSITLGSGGSGGIFAPALFIGAMLGESFGHAATNLIPSFVIPPGAFALVGMAAVFAGAAQAPISAIILLFEMTGNYQILPPLMVTCVVSVFIVRWMSTYSIYTLKLIRKGIDLEKLQQEDIMENISVSDAIIENAITVSENDIAGNVGLMIKFTNHRGFPVLNEKGKLVGMITRQDINRVLRANKASVPVAQVMTRNLVVAYPEENLKAVLHKMAERNIGRIPVVMRENPDCLLGLITRKSLIHAYNRAIGHGASVVAPVTES